MLVTRALPRNCGGWIGMAWLIVVIVRMLAAIVVMVVLIVVMVAMSMARQPPHEEGDACNDQHGAHQMPLLHVDLALKLKANHRNDAPQHDGGEHMSG
jgi:hypothetical protein